MIDADNLDAGLSVTSASSSESSQDLNTTSTNSYFDRTDVSESAGSMLVGDQEGINLIETPIVLHFVPTFIQVRLGEITSQLLGDCEMSVDLFNACLRSMKQQQDKTNSRGLNHFFEAEVMVTLEPSLRKN